MKRDKPSVVIESDEITRWLLEGDVSIRYQTHRDLLESDRPDLRERIAREGWGARFLAARHLDGSWARGYYQPKWTSSHYTLVDLKTLQIAPDNPLARESVHRVALEEKGEDGGINPGKTISASDACICGMFLDFATYFGEPEEHLASVVDFLLSQRMPDGGFNCRRNRSGARHSSLHTTISVHEGFTGYLRQGYGYRAGEVADAAATCREFMLVHRLFRSDRTGEVIHPEFLRLAFPPRWKYNVLRALDSFREAGAGPDPRMADALDVLRSKARSDGRWPLQAAHPGQVHFAMEPPRSASRWNTLLALRVLNAYDAAVPEGAGRH